MRKRVLLYRRFERLWHWSQAALIIALSVTGFDIHFDWGLFGFEKAHCIHNVLAWALIVLTTFTVFWHFTTGEWRQYVPDLNKERLPGMVRFYANGIFKGLPHPVHKTRQAKLNPLQRLAYLGYKLVMAPIIALSGVLYFFYNDWAALGLDGLTLGTVATIHVLAAFAIIGFMLSHVYLTTTGETLTSNTIAMLTGYEELEVDEHEEADA